MRRVAIQGGIGSYHGIAAEKYFKDEQIEIVPCLTFKNVFDMLNKEPNTVGIIAIENTIAGSLLPNHQLLRESHFSIAGEYKLRISHCLAALPGQNIHAIKEVQSHPIAIMQCEKFLDTLPGIKIISHDDTAIAAKEIADKKLEACAAICSTRAAELYGLSILASGIETNKHNYTRFLVFGNDHIVDEMQNNEVLNKSSIVFTLPHKEGSLSKVLSLFSFYDINLTKIQSLPIIGREWEYQFYVDLKYSDFERYAQSLVAIKPLINELKVLGEYPEGMQSDLI